MKQNRTEQNQETQKSKLTPNIHKIWNPG